MNPIAARIAQSIAGWRVAGQPLIVGICGTQASGKSTACAQLADHFRSEGLTVGVLSLDDLYLGRSVRADLASRVHPLLATRGPPGTHDSALGITVLDAVRRGETVALPRFDKRLDEQLPADQWPDLVGPADLLLFEGWCVGARAQDDADLALPVNALERDEDRDCVWRRFFTAHLNGTTGELFGRIDRLVYLRPPDFDVVLRWRCEQEHGYLASDRPEGAPAAMTDEQVARFIAHYERMTRHIMDEMPPRAGLVLQLDERRAVVSVSERGAA